MTQFLKHISLGLLLPIIITVLLVEVPLRLVPNTYSYKNQWMEMYSDSVEVLIFGSSHAFFGICPDSLAFNAFSLANMSQSIRYDKFLYDKYVNQCPNLKYIIWPISYFALRSEMEDGVEWWRIKGYCIYMNCPYHKFEPQYNLEIFSNINKNTFNLLKEAYCGKANRIGCEPLGWCESEITPKDTTQLAIGGETAARRHTKLNKEYVNLNGERIKFLIEDAEKRGIKILLIQTPTHESYYRKLNSVQLQELIQFCNYCATTYSNVRYVNWLQCESFAVKDFQDADHLNNRGAGKLSKMIDDVLHAWDAP